MTEWAVVGADGSWPIYEGGSRAVEFIAHTQTNTVDRVDLYVLPPILRHNKGASRSYVWELSYFYRPRKPPSTGKTAYKQRLDHQR